MIGRSIAVLAWALAAPAHAQDTPKAEMSRTPASDRPLNPAPAENFTGSVQLQPVFGAKAPSRVSAGSVTFAPGARSRWHTHPLGQHLLITNGLGWTQVVGGPIVEMHPGDVIWCPPGVRHWHGASPTSSVTHIAIQEAVGGKNVEWLEKVTDAEYSSR